jgi:hypothetical protein
MHRDSTSAHPPKEANKPGGGRMPWRQRKKLVAARKRLEEASAARKPLLMDSYIAALGDGVRSNPIVMEDVERAADLVILAAEMRLAVREGRAKVSDLTRLEGASDRATRRLNLPPGGAAAAPVPSLADYLAGRSSDDGDG